MTRRLRIFISHSTSEKQLALKLKKQLEPDFDVFLDSETIRIGRAWLRQMHQWMARCDCAVVLLTDGVLKKPEWVLKEAIAFAWRLDLDPRFLMFYVLAPGLSAEDFDNTAFRLAGLNETQRIVEPLADEASLDELVALLKRELPPARPPSPLDELCKELEDLLRCADRHGDSYEMLAEQLGVEGQAIDRFDHATLAQAIVCALFSGRDDALAIHELVERLGVWSAEHRMKLVKLLVPFWIDVELASALSSQVPRRAFEGMPPAGGQPLLTLAAARLAFTTEMTVRRVYGVRRSRFRLAEPVMLSGEDPYRAARTELCKVAFDRRWTRTKAEDEAGEDKVIAELRDQQTPLFVPLSPMPDSQTLERLRRDFPQAVFITERPAPADCAEALAARPLQPDPDPVREQQEYRNYHSALDAIDNY